MNARSTHNKLDNLRIVSSPRIWGIFLARESDSDDVFVLRSTIAYLTQKNAPERVLDALKSILDRHLDLFVFLEAKMQGYNRAPLFDRLNRYSQVAFFVQFVNAGS